MFLGESPIVIVALGLIQILGLASAWLARAFEGSRKQASFQFLFLGCLFIVGLATLASLMLTPDSWYLSGITLPLMVVAATGDFRRQPALP